MVVSWAVAPRKLAEIYRRFGEILGLLNVLMAETASTSEISVYFYQTTRRYNPEGRQLQTRRRENLNCF
jgi:hypothetical protein